MKDNNLLNLIVSPVREGMSEEERKLEDRRRIIRTASVLLVLLCTLFLAVAAGTMIALWSTGKTSQDLFAVMNGTYVYAKTQEELERIRYEEEMKDVTAVSFEEAGDASAATGPDVSNEVVSADEAVPAPDGAQEDTGEDEEGHDGLPDVTADGGDDDPYGSDAGAQDHADEGGDTDAALFEASGVNAYVDPNVNYPLPFTTVDESYFQDALFIGDSRLQGFGMYSGLPGTFYAATGFQLYKYDTMNVVNTDSGKVPILNAIPYDTFTKIYIKVGLNEMGGNDSAFLSKYAEFIARLREVEPRAIIYIHGILPVTAAKSGSDKVHNNTNVYARNESLKVLAAEQGAYYLDAGSVFMGADGCLPAEMAADGIHLKAQYMDIWKKYLMEHAIVL